jgi:hypothetical protein
MYKETVGDKTTTVIDRNIQFPDGGGEARFLPACSTLLAAVAGVFDYKVRPWINHFGTPAEKIIEQVKDAPAAP